MFLSVTPGRAKRLKAEPYDWRLRASYASMMEGARFSKGELQHPGNAHWDPIGRGRPRRRMDTDCPSYPAPQDGNAAANGAKPDTGLKAIGRVPWGSHFSIFYETRKDLLDILVPYFRAGLEVNEYCLWVVAPYEFASVQKAEEALGKALPELDRYLAENRMGILSYRDAFRINGTLDASKAVARYRTQLLNAQRRGLDGLRGIGSSGWVRENLRATKFRDYERKLDTLVANHRMIVACTFPLTLSGADEILDAARSHQFAVTLRNGIWKRVEIGDIEAAQHQARRTSPRLDELSFRQREILQRIAEGQNTKEIAAMLGISNKTVEVHRLRLMRRLKIHNVPGLVRFAIRTGLVSAES